MARTKFVKDNKGKFAGSIGAGKERAPKRELRTTLPPRPQSTETMRTAFEHIDRLFERFQASQTRQAASRDALAAMNAAYSGPVTAVTGMRVSGLSDRLTDR